jgi:CheY-like chemotaxis protein
MSKAGLLKAATQDKEIILIVVCNKYALLPVARGVALAISLLGNLQITQNVVFVLNNVQLHRTSKQGFHPSCLPPRLADFTVGENAMPDQAVILIAEDREDDVLLIRRCLARADIFNPIQVVHNGDEVINYLSPKGKFASRDEYPLPSLILLDLKMPRTDGFEVLRWIREHPALKALRIIVLTSSEDMRDVNEAYELGANSFLVKPMDFENFVEIGRFLRDYWLRTDKAPALFRPEQNKQTPG